MSYMGLPAILLEHPLLPAGVIFGNLVFTTSSATLR